MDKHFPQSYRFYCSGLVYNAWQGSNQWLLYYSTKQPDKTSETRLILQQRGANRKVRRALKKILHDNPDVTRKLRALWALHVTEGLREKELLKLLAHEDEYIRSWAVQLLAEDKSLSDAALQQFAEMAKTDPSALVRLYLASAMQRTTPEQRWETLEALMQRAEDKEDYNLPLMNIEC